MPDAISKATRFVRERGAGIAVEALVNFIGPYLIFGLAKKNFGEVNALIASSGPPIIWSLVEFARKRRVDAVSILVLAGIALSLLAFAGGGSVRLLQLREKLVTAAIGLIFLGSAIIRKPLIYQLARATLMRRSAAEARSFEALRDNVHFRRTMTLMTVVWGCGLIAEAGVASLLVLTMSVQQFLIVGPVVGYGTMGTLGLWTWWYARHQRRKGAARLAAEASAKAA